MISLLPARHETIVLPFSADDAFARIANVTSRESTTESSIIFYGWVHNDRFRLSLRQRRPSNYSPVIHGEIVSTSNGCILFVDYRLMPSMRMFITMWSLLIFLGSIFAGFQFKNMFYTLLGLGFIGAIHWVVWSNFSLHQRPAREALNKLFS